jgi:hypothetical protein
MDVTLAVQSMHFATYIRCYSPDFNGWVLTKKKKKNIQPSSYKLHCSSANYPLILSYRHYNRERREHRVFQSLLATVPGLADRITDKQVTEQDIRHIADLVKLSWPKPNPNLFTGIE